MRIQTGFEKIVATTNGQLFIWSFIGMRIFLGFLLTYLATASGVVTIWNMADPSAVTMNEVWNSIPQTLFFGLGPALMLGILVRPFACLGLIYLFAGAILYTQQSGPAPLLMSLPFVLLFGMFAAGGAGHVLGLDGVILRNIQRPGRLAKFLFG